MKKWTIFLVSMLGCAGAKGLPDCPTGYLWANDACTKKIDINFNQDRLKSDDKRTPVDSDTPVTPDGKTEVKPRDANAPATIGAPCKKRNDCKGITTETDCVPDTEPTDAGCIKYNTEIDCLNNDAWKDGYCALRDCLSLPCPTGSVCIAVSPQRAWCVAPCTRDSDCRTAEGYNCKAVMDSAARLTRACLPSGKGDTGDACTMYTDCKDAMDCLTSFNHGYCAKRACSKDSPCPDGAACVKLNEGSACLKSCKTDNDCKTDEIRDRSCSKLHSAVSDGDKEPVCVAGKGGKKVGDACTQNYECESNTCNVVFRGRCKDTTIPCNATSDCEGRVCDTTDPASILGYCTKDCKPAPKSCGSTSNSGPAVCLDTTKGFLCMPACMGQSCTINGAMTCAYGLDESGIGIKDYCMPTPKTGNWGTYCTQDSDCHNDTQYPECLNGSGDNYGYCTGIPKIGKAGRKCPFPMRYIKLSINRHLCLKYCRPGKDDCTNLPGNPAPGSGQTSLECRRIPDGNFCVIPATGTN